MQPIIENYESLDAALRMAETRTPHVEDFDHSRTVSSSRTKFTGTESFEEAARLARCGWPEGTAMAEAMRASIQSKLEAQIATRQIIEWDVTGADVDTSRYLDGEPENMVSFAEEITTGNKFVRVTVNLAASAGVSAEQLTRKGVAILALVDVLENQGTRCEIDLVAPFSLRNGEALYTPIIRIKNAQEPVEPDRLAFALSHPSMYRRLIFGLLEGSPKSHLERLGTGYGRPGDYSTTEGICVGPMQLWNDSQAADWVIGQLKSLGIEINETTTKN